MNFETLKKYKDMFIEDYDYSQQSDGMVWFHDVQLKDIPNVPFHFADSVVFEHTDTNLDVFIYQEKLSEPIEIKKLNLREDLEMAEELLEINENDEVTNVGVNDVAPEQEEQVNPFFAYLQNAFNKERSESFVETLTEEQKKFVFAFVSGFQSAIGHSIVGVYDYDYINGFHFTSELLQSVNVVLRPIEVTDLEMKFVVVAQY